MLLAAIRLPAPPAEDSKIRSSNNTRNNNTMAGPASRKRNHQDFSAKRKPQRPSKKQKKQKYHSDSEDEEDDDEEKDEDEDEDVDMFADVGGPIKLDEEDAGGGMYHSLKYIPFLTKGI